MTNMGEGTCSDIQAKQRYHLRNGRVYKLFISLTSIVKTFLLPVLCYGCGRLRYTIFKGPGLVCCSLNIINC